MLRRAGTTVSGDATRGDAQCLLDAGAFLYGGLDDLAARFAEYRDAGVGEIVLNLAGVAGVLGAQEALADLKVILTKLA